MIGRLYILPAGLISITLASSILLLNSNVKAETANASVIVPSACTLSNVIDTPHSAEINNNTYRTDIGTTTFNIVCNDSEGFSLYAIGYSNQELGNTKLLATIGGALTPLKDIVTGTATSGSTSNWAMKLQSVSGQTSPTITASYTNYNNVPSTQTKVATLTTATSGNSGVSVQSTYAAFISGTQPAGTYNGKVKYTMVHPASEVPLMPVACNSGKICYNPNASGVTDSMGDQSITSSATTANLWASNFQRTGYGFAGWSDKYDWVLNQNDANGNGTGANAGYHIYGPNETISFTAGQYTGSNPGLALYAVWVPTSGNLQGWQGCSAMNTGEVTALTDQRDNDVYAVAKLKDGKCWMIENLRLDNTAAHNSDGTLAQGYGTSAAYGNFSGLANPETTNFHEASYSIPAANSLYSSTTNGNKVVIGVNDYPSFRIPRYNNQNTNSPVANMTEWSNNYNVYSVGNWYNWPATIADTSYYDVANQSVTITSICPSGWHLPIGGSSDNSASSEFWGLGIGIMGFIPANDAYYQNSEINTDGKSATQAFRSYPNNFIYSGSFYNASAYGRGVANNSWSSTVLDKYNAYKLTINSSNVYPGTYNSGKFDGYSIRCIR